MINNNNVFTNMGHINGKNIPAALIFSSQKVHTGSSSFLVSFIYIMQ